MVKVYCPKHGDMGRADHRGWHASYGTCVLCGKPLTIKCPCYDCRKADEKAAAR